jgi:hypothetical protein
MTRLRSIVAVAFFVLAITSVPAHANRLATKAEAKWATKAFTAAPGHRGALISLIRISTVDTRWARVQFVPKPPKKSARASAKPPKPKDYDVKKGAPSSGKHKPKTPKKVKQDLTGGLILHMVLHMDQGEETGTSSKDLGCEGGGSLVESRQVHMTFSGTASFDVDLAKGLELLPEENFHDSIVLLTPFAFGSPIGSLENTYKWSQQGCETGTHSGECHSQGPIDGRSLGRFQLGKIWRSRHGLLFNLAILFDPVADGPCTPPKASNRWATNPGDMNVQIPAMRIGLYGGVNDQETTNFSFLGNSTGARQQVIHTEGFCQDYTATECSDELNYSGSLSITAR